MDFYQKILLHQHFMNIDHSWRNEGAETEEGWEDDDDKDGGMTPAEKPVDSRDLKELGASVHSLTTPGLTNEFAEQMSPIKRELSVKRPNHPSVRREVSFKMPGRGVGVGVVGDEAAPPEVGIRISGDPNSSFEEPNSKNLHKLFKKAAISATAYRKMDRDDQNDEFDIDQIIQRRSALGVDPPLGGGGGGGVGGGGRSFRRRRSTLRDVSGTSSGGVGEGEGDTFVNGGGGGGGGGGSGGGDGE